MKPPRAPLEPSPPPEGKRVVLAVAGAAHGVRGEIRLKCFTADPRDAGGYGPLFAPDGRRFAVLGLRPFKGDLVIARLAGT